jgi:hypothetical protein
MKRFWLGVTLLVVALPAAAQIDPGLVGMWQLQWVGPQILWQVRADGTYRLIGTGARPAEHWGRMQAAGGQWVSEWQNGKDRGSYALNGNAWTVTGSLGPGTWLRVWPGGAPSKAACPHIDVASVERQFASAVTGRMIGNVCELSAIKPGIVDEISIEAGVIDASRDTLRLFRAACASGTNSDPKVRCVPSLGETAFFIYGTLYIYQASSKIAVKLGTHPQNQAVNDADSIAIGKLVLARL